MLRLLDLALCFAQTVHLYVEGPELNKNIEVQHSSVHMKQSIVILLDYACPLLQGMALCLSAITFRNLLQNQQSFVVPTSPVTQHSTKFVSCSWNIVGNIIGPSRHQTSLLSG